MDIQHQILEKMKAYDTIMLFRHSRVDGDCVGATKGMKALIQASFPEKKVLIVDDEHSDYLAFLGEDDAPVADDVYAQSLAIVLDVSVASRISNPKYALCKELVKLDHHINVEPYGDLMWVEEERSSACEMVADFYDKCRDELTLTKDAALFLYTGMVTDSGRFRFSCVSGDTMRLAAMLLDTGIDTEWLFANLYSVEYNSLKFKAYVYENMHRTENGVAYFSVSKDVQTQFGLSYEQASAAISYLEGIRGYLCWLAFIESPDGSTRVRLRSRFLTINQVAEKYHGGGHACASGATVYSTDEAAALIADADEAVREYKAAHENWL